MRPSGRTFLFCKGDTQMESFIKKIWQEGLSPQKEAIASAQETKHLKEYISRHRNDLLKTMTDEQKEIFEKFESCWEEYEELTRESIFIYAFKLGIHLTKETFGDKINF